jgi:sugar lactone lactonase YvrE
MRTLFCLVAGMVLLIAVPASASAGSITEPATYVVSNTLGDNPENISVSADGTMYVSSVGTGAVYRGNTANATLHPFISAGADGRHQAAGVRVDPWGRIFVAGFDTGTLYVYDRDYDRDAHLLAKRVTVPGAALNDLAFGNGAVYVTDSAKQTIWRASLSANHVGQLTAWLTPDRFSPAAGFLNGIVITPDQRTLLVADQISNVTYRVNIARHIATALTVVQAPDGSFSADGLLLEGHRLYGVYNYSDPADPSTIDFVTRLVQLDDTYTTATWVADSAIVHEADTPTGIARAGCRLLWVNSQLFAEPNTTPYTVTQIQGLT